MATQKTKQTTLTKRQRRQNEIAVLWATRNPDQQIAKDILFAEQEKYNDPMTSKRIIEALEQSQ